MQLSRKRQSSSPLRKSLFQSRHLLIMIALPIVYFVIFCYIPMYGITIAFKDFKMSQGILGSSWAGLKYFKALFANRIFMQALRNTLILSVYSLVFAFPVSPILALMINEIRVKRFKRTAQTIIYLPHFISAVVAAGLVTNFLSVEHGLINDILEFFGGDRTYFLIEKDYFRPIVVFTSIWQGAGWGTIIYLAALSNVDTEVMEAAIVDGASRFQRIIHINVPCIMGTLVIMLILRVGYILTSDFQLILNLYNPMTYSTGDVLDTYIYRVGLLSSNQFSIATAAGFFKSLVGFILILFTNEAAKKLSGGEMRIW